MNIRPTCGLYEFLVTNTVHQEIIQFCSFVYGDILVPVHFTNAIPNYLIGIILNVFKSTSLATGTSGRNLENIIFKQIIQKLTSTWCEIVFRWMPQNLVDGKSTFVQIMTWCRQVPSHYLNQCWLRSLSSWGVSGTQWVKQSRWIRVNGIHDLNENLWYNHDLTTTNITYRCISHTVDIFTTPGPLFTKRWDVLPPKLVKSRSREIRL